MEKLIHNEEYVLFNPSSEMDEPDFKYSEYVFLMKKDVGIPMVVDIMSEYEENEEREEKYVQMYKIFEHTSITPDKL